MQSLSAFELPVDGDEGYGKAEMTGGGVALGEVNPSTLESRRSPGVYICGELFDALGRMGGFNFLWAWITGRLGGRECGGSGDAAGRLAIGRGEHLEHPLQDLGDHRPRAIAKLGVPVFGNAGQHEHEALERDPSRAAARP